MSDEFSGPQGRGDFEAQRAYETLHDMKSVEDAHALSARIHGLIGPIQFDEREQEYARIMLDVPEEWLLLFAWLSRRRRARALGQDAAFQSSIACPPGKGDRMMAKREMMLALRNIFHDELHWLSNGSHPVLKPMPFRLPAPCPGPDQDDDIPF